MSSDGGRGDQALAWSAALEQAGYLVTAIRPPSVPEGKARLRITLSAMHAPGEVDALVDALADGRPARAGLDVYPAEPPDLSALEPVADRVLETV